MKKSERDQRDDQVFQLWLSGASYRAIARTVGLSPGGVHKIVKRQLEATEDRRDLLTDEAYSVWQERYERVYQLSLKRAVAGDGRALESCRKLLADFARVTGLHHAIPVLAGTRLDAVEQPAKPVIDAEVVEPLELEAQQMDELARLRYNRAMGASANPVLPERFHDC